MNKFISAVFLLLLSFTTSEAQEQFTLSKAVEYALEHNIQIKNAQRDELAARYQKWETTAAGLPQINGKVEYNRFLELQKSAVPAVFTNPNASPDELVEIAFGAENTLNASATLSQLIFDGGYLVGLQSAKTFLEISALATEKTEIAVVEAVKKAYYNLAFAQEMEQITEKNLQSISEMRKESEILFTEGFLEEEAVEQQQITEYELENTLLKLKRLIALAKNSMNYTMGRALDDPLSIQETLSDLHSAEESGRWILHSFDNEKSIDVDLARNQLRSSELQYKYEKTKSLPNLGAALVGGYNAFSNSFILNNTDQKFFDYSLVAVTLNVPIFSSFQRTKAIQRKGLDLEKAQENFEETVKEQTLRFKQVKNNLEDAIATHETAKKNWKLSERIANKNEIKYKEGLSTSMDLRQAQIQLFQSQSNFYQSMLEILNAQAEIQSSNTK